MHTLFSALLRAHRLSSGGMSAGDAADRAGIGENTWRQYEAGARPGPTGLAALSEYLDIPVDDLKKLAATQCEEDHFASAMNAAVKDSVTEALAA